MLLLKILWLLYFIFFMMYDVVSFAQEGTINGLVKDGDFVLSSATILISNKTILTNIKGEFSSTLKAGRHTITITHVGYKKLQEAIEINSGEIKSLQFFMVRDEQMEEVMILGSRSFVQRSYLNTAVPVDLISSKQLQQTGQLSLIQMMGFAVPSINTSRQNLFEPVTLRGLSPDHTLVLLNGTRYHNTAFVNVDAIRGTLGTGSVGNDLSSIPFSAIEKIEILRDGSSAQYGSDAIAGVINIILKKATEKTVINLQLGQQYKGDGESILFGINRGIKLNKKAVPGNKQGYLNLSGDFLYRMPTHRGGNYLGTVYKNLPPPGSTKEASLRIIAMDDSIISARNFSRKTPVSNDGNIKLSRFGILLNGAYPINKQVELFWTGSVNYRYALNRGAYRFPKTITQVNTDLWPDGFKIKAITNSRDITAIVGVRGKTNTNWNWEWESTYGENSNKQIGRNTNNASQYLLGENATTEFYGGRFILRQQINNISIAKDLAKQVGNVKTFNIGLGVEYRYENYRTIEGEEASWKDYDYSGIRTGGAAGTGGIRPEDAIDESRDIASFYIDLESDINESLLINMSGRYEYYDILGGNITGKLAMRYKFSSKFFIRGSISNGYHAPALPQIHLNLTSIVWRLGIPLTTGIFSNKSDIAKSFGLKPLQPEKAINASAGLTSTLSRHLNVTVDGYWIEIRNRIVLSGIFDKTNPGVYAILHNRDDIDQVRFISNAINTTTRGIDVVINSKWIIQKSALELSLVANFTQTKLFGPIQVAGKLSADVINKNTLFNTEEREKIEHSQPSSKIILSANYKREKMGVLIRSTRFGETAIAPAFTDPITRVVSFLNESFSPKILTDFNFYYSPTTWLTLTAGINNIFDIYPDPIKNPLNQNQGILKYSNQGTPYGYNGGYYFLSMSFNW